MARKKKFKEDVEREVYRELREIKRKRDFEEDKKEKEWLRDREWDQGPKKKEKRSVP